jgi:phage major head subunit gpT-like protein
MLINKTNLNDVFSGFKTSFRKGFDGAESHFKDVAMVVPSSTREETYGWLGQFPKIQEWVGDRVIKNLVAHSYAVKNKLFEDTIAVKRVDVEDDQYGVLSPLFDEMGRAAAEHPDELIFSLLAAGFATQCFDGQYFFDTDHPVGDQTVSNMQAGAGVPWFLLDTSKAIKPMLFQNRSPYNFQQMDKDGDENVFMRDEFLYGVRGRANAGFGLWQLAYASKDNLTAANYEAARKVMMELKGDEGRPLGIKPNILVVPASLEGDALRLLNNGSRVETYGAGPDYVAVTNEWAGTADVIVSAWL